MPLREAAAIIAGLVDEFAELFPDELAAAVVAVPKRRRMMPLDLPVPEGLITDEEEAIAVLRVLAAMEGPRRFVMDIYGLLPDRLGIKPVGYAVAAGMPDKGIETWCWLYSAPYLRRLVPANIEGHNQIWFGGRIDRGRGAR